MILVSACLAGIYCRYNGTGCSDDRVVELVRKGQAIPICPEQIGGCPTPRPPAEIKGGTGADVLDGRCRVYSRCGRDVTEEFVRGAKEVLKIASITGAGIAVMKSRSPSCGYGLIYDGTFTGKLIKGNGVTSELLSRNGLTVVTEEDAELPLQQLG